MGAVAGDGCCVSTSARLKDHSSTAGAERVGGERFADVDPRVVDQGVYPAEPPERLLDHSHRRIRLGDVPLDGEEVGLVSRRDRARRRNDDVPGTAKRRNKARADAALRP